MPMDNVCEKIYKTFILKRGWDLLTLLTGEMREWAARND